MTIYGQLVSLWAYQVDTSVVHACGPAAGSIRSLSRTKTGSEGALARKCREMVQTGETWSQWEGTPLGYPRLQTRRKSIK